MTTQHDALKQALEKIAETNASKHGTTSMMLDRCIAIARQALSQQAEQEPQPVAITDKRIDDAAFALGIQGYAYVDDPAGYRALVRQFAAPAKPAEQERSDRDMRIAKAVREAIDQCRALAEKGEHHE